MTKLEAKALHHVQEIITEMDPPHPDPDMRAGSSLAEREQKRRHEGSWNHYIDCRRQANDWLRCILGGE